MKKRESRLAVYAAELAVGTALGLALFLGLLWLLDRSLPGSTGLGELVRGRGLGERQATDLDIDAPADEVVALLSTVRRDVRDRPASSVVWDRAGAGKPLGDRHAVQSFAGSAATITFDAQNVLELEEKSVVVVRRPRRVDHSSQRRASVLFVEGFLRARLGPTRDDTVGLDVVVPGGLVRPHGEEGGAEMALAMDNQRAALSVHEGAADLVWEDRTTAVPAGYMVTFDSENGPGEPIALPDPPVRLSPPEGSTFSYRATPPQVSFEWEPPDATDRFRLEIARDPDFHEIVFETDQEQTTFTHGNLESGLYFWRVAGLRQSLAGPVGAGSTFRVERDRSPPALSVELEQGIATESRFVVRGVTEPGCRVVIGDVHVPTDAGGRFEHTLHLHNGYNFLVVQSIDSTGNTAFANHTVVAELEDTERESR